MESISAIFDILESKRGCLDHLKFDSVKSRGRRYSDERYYWAAKLSADPFIGDQYKIEHSRAWRRLGDKTQVFSLPFNSNIRKRLSHVQEVAGLAALFAHFLGLNVELAVCIGKGHDIGHPPFGHVGERFIEWITGKKFDHADYGPVVLQEIERGGHLNLSFEVLEGIIFHDSSRLIPLDKPQEYALVRHCDKIAWVLHDISDSVRKGFIKKMPPEIAALGAIHQAREEQCVGRFLLECVEQGRVSFEDSIYAQLFQQAKRWLTENVYRKIDDGPRFGILEAVYSYLAKESQKEESKYFKIDPAIALSLLTDGECWRMYQAIIDNSEGSVENPGAVEIFPFIRDKKIDWEKPDLSWGIK